MSDPNLPPDMARDLDGNERLEELVTSGALPGSYDPTEFRDEEDGELLIDNPWLDDEG